MQIQQRCRSNGHADAAKAQEQRACMCSKKCQEKRGAEKHEKGATSTGSTIVRATCST